MKQTYSEAIAQVFRDEGGYSNVAGDKGGPTNYGITIIDARKYWKPEATAQDVKDMPKSVAEDIYRNKYAKAISYDSLDPGVDYACLDYGIHSGVSRSLKILKQVQKSNSVDTINAIYDEREGFLTRLSQRPQQEQFKAGWLNRTRRGRKLALALNEKYKSKPIIGAEHGTATGTVVATTAVAASYPHLAIYIVVGGVLLAVGLYFAVKYLKGKTNNV